MLVMFVVQVVQVMPTSTPTSKQQCIHTHVNKPPVSGAAGHDKKATTDGTSLPKNPRLDPGTQKPSVFPAGEVMHQALGSRVMCRVLHVGSRYVPVGLLILLDHDDALCDVVCGHTSAANVDNNRPAWTQTDRRTDRQTRRVVLAQKCQDS